MLVSAHPVQSQLSSIVQTITTFPTGSDLCIICDGAVSMALASLITAAGHNVRLWPINETVKTLTGFAEKLPDHFEVCERTTGLCLSKGKPSFGLLTPDAKVALKGSDGLIICQPVTEYGALVARLAPVLENGQTVCLCNAALGAGFEFRRLMRKHKKDLQINVIEIGYLLDCARNENNVLVISGQREKVSFCGITRNETRRGLAIANTISGGLVPTSNTVERGLSEVEKILRPVFLLFALLGGRSEELEDIASLVNPRLTKLIVALDKEIQALAQVYHVVVPSFLETLTHFGGVSWEDADCLGQALISIASNLLQQRLVDQTVTSMSPEDAMALLRVDIKETFSLLYDMARLSRTHVPVISSVIELARIVVDEDLLTNGRKLDNLGLIGFGLPEMIELINA